MSYPLQPYNPNHGALMEQQIDRPTFDGNNRIDGLLGSFLGLANQLMGEILRNGPPIGSMSPFMGLDPMNPHMQVIGMSSMNVMQVARGPDGRPHIMQAVDERRMGPGGVWQTRKALRDPDRGIDKMQIGYFAGDHSEVIERRLDPTTGQYRQEIQQRAIPPSAYNLPNQPQLPPPQQYQYYPQQQQQQQRSPYAQQPLQALPAPSPYRYI